jgi:DNA helicase-2/ATP-dependent DNA helicase PcrA
MQKAAVLHTEGPLLLIAGAGSGKTRVLTHRMAHIAGHLARPYEMLAITFTNRAAKEMKERIHRLKPYDAHDMWVATFHSCCVRILRREIHHIGYDNSFVIYDMDDAAKLLKGVLKEMNVNERQFPPKSILSAIGRQKDELVGPEDFAAMSAGNYRDEIMAEIYKNYQKQLYGNNALDFDDIILKTLELFMRHPIVLDKYARRFRYIMVDEYQDTNTAQYQLVRLLASVHGNICVVGDDDQSIYGWRGANIRNILDFEKDFYGAAVIKLEQNYRSTGNILEAANGVIAYNQGRKAKKLWTRAQPGESLNFFKAESDYREADYIVEKISQGLADGAKHKDFAVLYRINSLSRVIEEKLVERNMRYRIYGGIRFYERREVKDTLAYLRAIHNPHDDISIKRIINVPKRGIGGVAVDFFEKIAAEHDIKFYDVLKNAEMYSQNTARNRKIANFIELLEDFRARAAELPLEELVKEVLTKSGYHSSIVAEDEADGTDRAANLSELINKAAGYEADDLDENEGQTSALAAFLEDVALVADIDDHSENDDTVALMTLHSSKGLEFPTVFLPAFEEGIFPTYRAVTSGEPAEIEEERRLCYVGITRAKQRVYISMAGRRRHNGQTISNAPSRFLQEIPQELVESQAVPITPPPPPRPAFKRTERAAQNIDFNQAAMQPNFGKKWDLSKIKKM